MTSDAHDPSTPSGAPLRRAGFLLWFLIALGVAVLVCRGPFRAMPPAGSSSDFALFYASTRAWIHGADPYSPATAAAEWAESGSPGQWHEEFSDKNPVLLYPPSALAIFAPIAALPWPIANALWALLNVAFAIVSIWAVARLAEFRGVALLAFLALAVWLQPAGSTARVGQTSLLVMAALSTGELLRARARPLAGGLFLGLAVAVKPQLAILFVIYELGRFRWKPAIVACVTPAILFGLGAARLIAGGTPWFASWRRQLHDFPIIGNADPSLANPNRHQMLNLHYPLHTLIDGREVVQAVVYSVIGALCLGYLVVDTRRNYLARERSEGRADLLSLSMVSVVTLLVAYHRFYDGVVLLFPAALAIRLLAEGKTSGAVRRAGWALLVLLIPFMFPVTAVLLKAMQDGRIPASISGSPLWTLLIMPHEVWALLAMAFLLVWMRARLPAAAANQRPQVF